MGPVLAGITARFGCPKWLLKMKHFYAENQLLEMDPLISSFGQQNCPLAAGLCRPPFAPFLYDEYCQSTGQKLEARNGPSQSTPYTRGFLLREESF